MILFDKIFLIDDEHICNYISTKILTVSQLSHSIESFLDAKSALTEIKNQVHNTHAELKNLILLDINMPGMNGWTFLDEFEKLPEDLLDKHIVMMLSSSIDSRDIDKSKTYKSVKKFISKPFSIDKILE